MKSSFDPRVESLVAQMTLDEKLAQLGSYWIYELQAGGEIDRGLVASKLKHGIGQITRIGGASGLGPAGIARVGNRLQKFLVEETRLGIPAILHEEACCGAMVQGGTVFPQMLGLAATFQPELAEAMGTAIRRQLRQVGARQALAPVLDVDRDPRWGRVEETFGEDPVLASQFGVGYVRGLQGADLREGVLATGKHFIGHSHSQGGLNCGPVHIGWQEIWEVLMPPFQAAITEASLGSIMNSYPELDGEVVAASRRILTGLLREKLGFDGLVVSDYEAVAMLHSFHFAASDPPTAAALALRAGIDVELPTARYYREPLVAALEAGKVRLEDIDQAVSRHLQKKIELGLFDSPYVDEEPGVELLAKPEDRALARQIARQSLVLLKNDGILPLPGSLKTLAVIGPNADSPRGLLGDYSYTSMRELLAFQGRVDPAWLQIDPENTGTQAIRVTTILDGIQAAVSPDTQVLYAQGCDHLNPDPSGIESAVELARQAEAVVLALGDVSGLVPACTCGETRDSADLNLPGLQEELARAICALGKPVVVVLVSGRPYAIPELDAAASAILEAWLPGEEGGAAVAEILFGQANPGGKLPITFPRSAGQIPIFYSHKPSAGHSHWYGDYVSEKATPLYPFGHGLSYTRFEFSSLNLSPRQAGPGESIAVSLEVCNAGGRAGEEVVQLYVRDEFASTPRPVKELKGFARVRLEPGETRRISFQLPVDFLAFYDHDLNLVLEPGRIFVMVGSSSEDIRLRDEFEIAGTGKMAVTDRVFACPVEIRPVRP
jgi:beta-glucosidase